MANMDDYFSGRDKATDDREALADRPWFGTDDNACTDSDSDFDDSDALNTFMDCVHGDENCADFHQTKQHI